MVPATAVPSDEPRFDTKRDSPEISLCWSSGKADWTTFTEGVSITPRPNPISSNPGRECPFARRVLDDEKEEHHTGDGRDESGQDQRSLLTDLVVRPLHRPGVHLRGPGPVLRAGRRGAQGPAHRPDGGPWHLPGQEVHPACAGGRVRPVPRHRDQSLPGQGRQAEGESGAPLPRREGAVPRGVRGHGCAGEPGRAQRAGSPLDRGAHPLPHPPGHGRDPR